MVGCQKVLGRSKKSRAAVQTKQNSLLIVSGAYSMNPQDNIASNTQPTQFDPQLSIKYQYMLIDFPLKL